MQYGSVDYFAAGCDLDFSRLKPVCSGNRSSPLLPWRTMAQPFVVSQPRYHQPLGMKPVFSGPSRTLTLICQELFFRAAMTTFSKSERSAWTFCPSSMMEKESPPPRFSGVAILGGNTSYVLAVGSAI